MSLKQSISYRPTPTSCSSHNHRRSLDTMPPPTSTPATDLAIHLVEITMTLLHRRLGHSGQPAMQRLLSENMVTSLSKMKPSGTPSSNECQLGMLTRPSHPSRPFEHNTTCALQLVVMDLAVYEYREYVCAKYSFQFHRHYKMSIQQTEPRPQTSRCWRT